jgi:hypothetical protein
MADPISYVGLDVHKDGIVIAIADSGLRGEVREYGRIANTPAALESLIRKLGSAGTTLRFCYEASPCGYGISVGINAVFAIERDSRHQALAELSSCPLS